MALFRNCGRFAATSQGRQDVSVWLETADLDVEVAQPAVVTALAELDHLDAIDVEFPSLLL